MFIERVLKKSEQKDQNKFREGLAIEWDDVTEIIVKIL